MVAIIGLKSFTIVGHSAENSEAAGTSASTPPASTKAGMSITRI